MDEDKIKEFQKKQQEIIEKYGFIVHAVPGNVHTHGLPENLGHPNFQIVLNIDPRICHSIINILAGRVKKGEKFRANTYVSRVIENFKIQLLGVTDEDGEKLLRIVLPDANGKFPHQEGCDINFVSQGYMQVLGGEN